MENAKSSNATVWVIFKHCAAPGTTYWAASWLPLKLDVKKRSFLACLKVALKILLQWRKRLEEAEDLICKRTILRGDFFFAPYFLVTFFLCCFQCGNIKYSSVEKNSEFCNLKSDSTFSREPFRFLNVLKTNCNDMMFENYKKSLSQYFERSERTKVL